ncbi:MAG: hypothetical protein AWU57_1235 [Marinobacter sp. T13-3]|nr:MAG: hypothetical protein AWU57_1235 [Marinobacter sp. T13-3]
MRVGIRQKIVCVLVMLALAGCQDLDRPDGLRLAVNSWPGYGYFAVAGERGLLNEPGTPVLEIVETSSLSDSVRAFKRGQVDMLGGTLAELAAINQFGNRAASAVLVLNRSVGADMIVASDDITRLDQLAGKRLALEPVSANVLVLAAALAESGLQLNQLELLPLPQGEMPAAMTKGRVDAAITYPPISIELEALAGFSRLFDTGQAPDAVIDLLIVADDVINQHPQELASIIRAHDEALRWGKNNPAEVNKLLSKHTGLSVEELVKLSDSIEMLTLDSQAAFWQPTGPLHRLLPVAGRIVQQLNTRAAEGIGIPSQVLNNRFIPNSEAP